MSEETGDADLGFLLNRFAAQVSDVSCAVAVSADGLLIAKTDSLPRDRADQLAAIAAGLVSLLAGAARALEAGAVVSNMTELDGGFMFSMAVSGGASLLVLAAKSCDVLQVSYAMTDLINRVGQTLTPPARHAWALDGQPAR